MVKIEPRGRVCLVINSFPLKVDFRCSALITRVMNAVTDALAVFRKLAGMMFAFSTVAHANTNIGLISFDFLIPGQPGVNAFDIFNFSGDPNMGLINCNLGRHRLCYGTADREVCAS